MEARSPAGSPFARRSLQLFHTAVAVAPVPVMLGTSILAVIVLRLMDFETFKLASLFEMVKRYALVTSTVGVPLMTPVDEFNARPVGRAGTTFQLLQPEGPTNCALYEVPTWPNGRSPLAIRLVDGAAGVTPNVNG